MPGLPILSAREVVGALQRAGFVVERQTGSHMVLAHDERRRVAIVPMHAGRDIPTGLLKGILRQAGLSGDEFRGLLR
jgi:predicted RNA binding protein YcfA (HicA-like mRNA interferase family)